MGKRLYSSTNSDLSQTSHCNIKGASVSEVMRILVVRVREHSFVLCCLACDIFVVNFRPNLHDLFSSSFLWITPLLTVFLRSKLKCNFMGKFLTN